MTTKKECSKCRIPKWARTNWLCGKCGKGEN
jgi:hypothetical protein